MSEPKSYLNRIQEEQILDSMSEELKEYFDSIVNNGDLSEMSAGDFSYRVKSILNQYDSEIEYVDLVDQDFDNQKAGYILITYLFKITLYSGENFYLNAYTKIMEKHILN